MSRLVFALMLLAALPAGRAEAQSCTGRFVNPIADVCWECLFPISIGPIRMGSASGAPDTPNPSSPICFCGSPVPRIGLSLGVWEPARLMDVTRTPWCFPNLGGLTIDPGLPAARGRTGSSGGDGAQGSVWHAHYYVYPLLSWIGALIDLGCLEGGSLDIAWTSELDPAWLDDELSFLLNPEAALFANLPAQAACAADCAAASAGLPLDPMFWCAGCQGGMYPLTGNVAAHVGGVQASLLAAQRLVYRLHRAGLAWGTSGSAALCGRYAGRCAGGGARGPGHASSRRRARTGCARAWAAACRISGTGPSRGGLRFGGGSAPGRARGGPGCRGRPSRYPPCRGWNPGEGRPAGVLPAGRPENAVQPLCLRSHRSPDATEPQYWIPLPLMRRPVQTMISVRAGRSAWTSFSETVGRFALRRPFGVFSSPGQRRMSPSTIAWKRSTT